MFLGKTLLEEQDWYEKDLSDFEDPQLSDEEHEGKIQCLFLFGIENFMFEFLVQQTTGRSKHKQRSKQSSLSGDNLDGEEYPLDLWFIIAMYIPPEDIGKFSQICRASNHVVNTVYFWMRLFKKYMLLFLFRKVSKYFFCFIE